LPFFIVSASAVLLIPQTHLIHVPLRQQDVYLSFDVNGLSATQLHVCRFLKKNVKLNVFENRQEKGNSKTRLKHADYLNILSC